MRESPDGASTRWSDASSVHLAQPCAPLHNVSVQCCDCATAASTISINTTSPLHTVNKTRMEKNKAAKAAAAKVLGSKCFHFRPLLTTCVHFFELLSPSRNAYSAIFLNLSFYFTFFRLILTLQTHVSTCNSKAKAEELAKQGKTAGFNPRASKAPAQF